MAYTFDFIFGAEAHAGRAARRTQAGCEYGHKGVVVIVEVAHMRYEELDADSIEHGEGLARAWVQNRMAIAASVWTVTEAGALGKRAALIAESGTIKPLPRRRKRVA